MKVLIALLVLLVLPVAGWANRVALVIGNSDYTSVVPLDNPRNDSAAVARALTKQGFEVVVGDNLGRVEMRDTLRQFRALADKADIALVYYAGHGIEIAGTNYLVPVDARLEDERDAGLEMIEVDLVLRQISGARTLKMVVLDACRNNPFVIKMQRQGSNRSIGQGLGEIRSNQADTLISYAAAAGDITPDGRSGENSPFTAAFLASLDGPPMDVRRMLGQVRDRMRLSVPGAAPFVYSSLGGGEYIINPRSAGAPPVQSVTAPVAKAVEGSISKDFVRIDRNGSVQDWNDFLIRHELQSDHPLYAFALEKRATLQGDVVVASRTPGTAANPTNPPAVSVPSPQPSPVALAPARSGEEPVAATAPAFVTTPVMTVKQAAKALQTELKERACYSGRIDGLFGRNSMRGLTAFSKEAEVPINLASSPDARQLWAAKEVVAAFPDVKCPQVVVKRRAPSKPKPQQKAAAKPQAPKAPVVAEEEPVQNWNKKKANGPVFSTLPCPKSDELRMRRPECH